MYWLLLYTGGKQQCWCIKTYSASFLVFYYLKCTYRRVRASQRWLKYTPTQTWQRSFSVKTLCFSALFCCVEIFTGLYNFLDAIIACRHASCLACHPCNIRSTSFTLGNRWTSYYANHATYVAYQRDLSGQYSKLFIYCHYPINQL